MIAIPRDRWRSTIFTALSPTNSSPMLILRRLGTCMAGLFVTAALSAQEAKYRVEVKTDFGTEPDEAMKLSKMVKGDATSLVALKTNGGQTVLGGIAKADLQWNLTTYDKASMKPVKTDAPKIVYGVDPVNLETIEFFNGQFRLIASQPDYENARLRLIQQVLNPRSLTGKGAREFYAMPFDHVGKGPEYFKKNTTVGFGTAISVDSTKLMLQLSPDLTNRSAGLPIHAMVFNKDMKLLWHGNLQTASSNRAMQILGTRVDRNGAAWYLVRNISDPEPEDPKVIGYDITLYRLDSTGQQQVKLDLPGGDYATDARIELLPDGKVACAGVYSSEDHSRGESLGLFFTTLDPATFADPKGGQWGAFKQNELEKVQDKRKGEVLQRNVKMVRFFPRADGGADIVAENNSLETYMSSTLAGKQVQKTQWEHGDVHVMRLSPVGEPVWYTVLDRALMHDTNEPGRIIAASYGGNLYLFFNDDEMNIEKRKELIPIERTIQARDAMMFEFKADGGYKAKAVLKQDPYDEAVFDPTSIWFLTPAVVAVPGALGFGKKDTFATSIQFSGAVRR